MNVTYKMLPEAVALTAAGSKKAIFEALADRFGQVYGLDQTAVIDGLEEREALGSTGFGRGIAIPHARLDHINRPVAALLRLDSPVDFDAADGMPVDLVFGLISPANAGISHLHALASISRLARDEHTHEALTEAQDAEAIYALLTNVSDRDAA